MILKGKKVLLRKNRVSDAQRYLKWLADPAINRYIARNAKSLTLEKEKAYIKSINQDKKKSPFAICTSKGKHVGIIGLGRIDLKNKSASLYIFIGDKDYQNLGLGTNAILTFLEYAFLKLNLNRIELGVYEDNKRGQKVYQKVGFKKEGKRKQAIFKNGRFIDDVRMAILKKEWEAKYGKQS